MAYANVKCEDCGLIMPQNEAIAVNIGAETVASNEISFGLSGGNLRQWKQGDRTYNRTKRIFFCQTCYENYKVTGVTVQARRQPSEFKTFLTMAMRAKLYQFLRGAWKGVFG